MPLDVDGLSFAELVQAAAALNDDITAKIAGYNAWAVGAADGGPEGDGRFPLPVLGDPGAVLLPSPAKIAADAAPYVVGLFGAISARTIPAAVTRIQTSGKTVTGKGGAVYGVTANTGETAFRTQSADGRWWELLEDVPALWDFGWSATDCGPAILAALAWAGTSGQTLLVPGQTFNFADPIQIAQHGLTMVGIGWKSLFKGPGFYAHGAVNTHNGPRNLTFRDFKLDGTDYQDPGDRGIDILATNELTIENVYFDGFYDQVVVDQVQRTRIRRSEFHAGVSTRSSLWFPRGPEAHAGVSLSASPSNIASVVDNHFDGVNGSTTSWAMVVHAGHQQRFVNNQVSKYRAAMRLGNVTDATITQGDYEFQTTYALETVATNFDGVTISGPTMLTVGPGNYFDEPSDVQHCFALNVINNNIRPSPSAFVGVASVRAVRSIGNKCPAGRTILDAVPAVSGASLFQADEEGTEGVFRWFNADGGVELPGLHFVSSPAVGGRLGRFELGDGQSRTRWLSDGVEFLRIHAALGYLQLGNLVEGLAGPRIFGGEDDPNVVDPPNAQDGSVYFRTLPDGASYSSQTVIWVKGNGSWKRYISPGNFASFATKPAPSADNKGQCWLITDRGGNGGKPAWSTGGNWVWSDGAVAT